MFSLYQTLSLRYLRMHRARTVLVVLSIALGVATWVATDLLNQSLGRSIRRAATPLAGIADFFVTNNALGSVDVNLVGRLARVPGVQRVQPLVLEKVRVEQAGESKPGAERAKSVSAMLIGVGLSQGTLSENGLINDLKARGIDVDEKDLRNYGLSLEANKLLPVMLQLPPPVLVGEKMDQDLVQGREKLLIHVGSKTHMLRRVGQVRAKGTSSSLGGYVLFMDDQSAAHLLGQPGRVSRLDITLNPEADKEQVTQALRTELGNEADLQSPQDNDRRLQDVLKGIEIGFKLCGAGALVVGMFLVYNALSVSVAERRYDIGIMRSVGATRHQVRFLFLGEAVLQGLMGTALGLPLGLALAHLSLGPIQEVLKGLFLPVTDKGQLDLNGMQALAAATAGIMTAVVAALVPASQAAAEEPADAVRRAPRVAGMFAWLIQLAGSVVLACVGIALVAHKATMRATPGQLFLGSLDADEVTFLGLACLLLGCLLATPFLAACLTRCLQPLMRWLLPIEGRLAMDNLVRSPGRTGLVIGALAAGVALMVQTAGIIRSNEDAFLGWIDNTVQADLYLTSGGPISTGGEVTRMDETIVKELLAPLPEGGQLLPQGTQLVANCYRYVDWKGATGGTKIFLVVVDALEHYRANHSRLPNEESLDLYRRLAEEPGTAVISENFSVLHNVQVGDTITLKGEKDLSYRVIGTLLDYSWNRGTVIVDRTQNVQALQAQMIDSFDVYLPPGSNAPQVRDQLQKSALGARFSLFAMTKGEVRHHVLELMHKLYGLAYTQEVLVGIVAVLGVVMALLISVLGRRRELGLLRAVGGTQWQLVHSVLAEAMLIGLVGTILGILLGTPLEWYAVRVVLFDEAGFLFPVKFPWLAVLSISLLAIGAATLAGLGPAIQAMRLRIADAIAYE